MTGKLMGEVALRSNNFLGSNHPIDEVPKLEQSISPDLNLHNLSNSFINDINEGRRKNISQFGKVIPPQGTIQPPRIDYGEGIRL